MHRILAEKSVNITELRKNPAKYFIDQPVAVLSNNRPAGYLLSASAFEALMDMLAEQEEKKARFRPSAARLEEITRRAEKYLNDMTDDDFNDFKE
ncbi:type I toxin-antitoxin system antitoxin YafN [Escherichia coli]